MRAMTRPKIVVFASGTKDAGGSGFENLVDHSRGGELDADIVAVVSQHEHGGVREKADRLGISFVYFPEPYDTENYSSILQNTRIEKTELWVALSGWTKLVHGLDPVKTFNIHPALLSQLDGRFGGKGMYGHHIHDAVAAACMSGEVSESGFSMHFVTDEYDRGPVFFEKRIQIAKDMTPEDIQKAVQAVEHEWQPRITNMVVHGEISWDGIDPKSVTYPAGYEYVPKG